MSLEEASEIVASTPCPHCKAVQYLTILQLGQNLECRACGEQYGAPMAPGARASATLWGAAKPPSVQPNPEPPREETAWKLLWRLHREGAYWGTRWIARLLSFGASIYFSIWCVVLGISEMLKDNSLKAAAYLLASVAVVLAIQMLRGVIDALLDIADILADQHRRRSS